MNFIPFESETSIETWLKHKESPKSPVSVLVFTIHIFISLPMSKPLSGMSGFPAQSLLMLWIVLNSLGTSPAEIKNNYSIMHSTKLKSFLKKIWNSFDIGIMKITSSHITRLSKCKKLKLPIKVKILCAHLAFYCGTSH